MDNDLNWPRLRKTGYQRDPQGDLGWQRDASLSSPEGGQKTSPGRMPKDLGFWLGVLAPLILFIVAFYTDGNVLVLLALIVVCVVMLLC